MSNIVLNFLVYNINFFNISSLKKITKPWSKISKNKKVTQKIGNK